jgi:hypothetical protein
LARRSGSDVERCWVKLKGTRTVILRLPSCPVANSATIVA